MAFFSFLIAALLFLYAALAPVFDYTISGDFNVVAWGLFFTAAGLAISHYAPGGYGRGRGLLDRDRV